VANRIAEMNVKVGFDGKDAIKGSGDVVDSMRKVVSESDRVAKAEAKGRAMRLAGLNALEIQQSQQRDATKERRRGMTVAQIERDMAREQMAERLKGMNALERQEAIEAEKKRARRMGMTAAQIKKEIEAEEKTRKVEPKTSLFERVGIKGLADAKAGLEMIRGVMQTFVITPVAAAVSIMKMGSALDNMRTIASGLETQLGGGAKAIESLRAISLETGAPLDDLNKAMLALSASGISLEESATMIGRASNAITLLGGGAEAANTVASALGSLQESARASEASLRPLQASGLNVFGALAKEISRSTGQAVTLAEAMEMLREGSVLSSTAVRAVFTASNDAAAAAEAVGNSFAGQLAKLSAGFDDLLREIGSQMLKIFEPESGLSFLRGMFEGIKETVKGIADAMGMAVDPKDKGAKLKEIFESGKQFGEKLGKALVDGAKLIGDVINKLLPDLQKIIKDIKDLDLGKAGGKLIAGAVKAPFEGGKSLGEQIMSDIDKGFNLGIAPGKGKLDQIIAETERMKEAARGGKFDGEMIIGDFDNIEEALDGFDKVTEDFVAELIRQTEDLNQANRSAEQLRKEVMREQATEAEKFATRMAKVESDLAQASGANEAQQALLRGALGRQVGRDIQGAIERFRSQQQQDLPRALVAGSAEEVEARIRAERGVQTEEQEMLAALEAQVRQGDQQIAALDRLVAIAAANGKAPATLVMPK